MGTLANKTSLFPPAQRAQLESALKGYRRRVDYNYNTVAVGPSSTTQTTIASLIAKANELEIGSVVHLRVSGTVTNNTGASTSCTVQFLLEDNGLDLHDDVTLVVGDDSAGTESQAFIYNCRIYWKGLAAVTVDGALMISKDDQTEATVGTGAFTASAEAVLPFVGSSTSAQLANDHVYTLKATLGLSDAAFSLSKLTAALWVE